MSEKKNKLNIKSSLLGLIILISTLMLTVWLTKQKKAPPQKKITEDITYIKKTPVALSNNQIILKTQGFVLAKRQSMISSQVSGQITFVSPQLEQGNIVEKGELLIRIDDTNYLANLALAKSTLAKAKTTLEQEKARAIQMGRDVARTQIKANQLALNIPQVNEAKAALESAKAQVSEAQRDIDRTQIKAPFQSLVLSREVSNQELASDGLPLFSIASLDTFTIEIPLSSVDINLINQINPVQIEVLTDNQKIWKSHINRFDAQIDPDNRTLSAFADIKNPYQDPKHPLRIESFVDIHLYGNKYPNTIWINNSAIINNQYVWAVKSDNTLKQAEISVIYSEKGKSLITFKEPTDNYIKVPLSSFVINKKITTNIKDIKKAPIKKRLAH